MEFLLMIRDRVGETVFDDTKLYKRGMVVDVHEDGWDWGHQELVNPDFRVLKAPGLDKGAAISMLSAEAGFADADYSTSTLQIRAARFDIDAQSLPADFAAYIADDARAAPFYLVGPVDAPDGAGQLTSTALMAVKAVLAPVANPLILGLDDTVL